MNARLAVRRYVDSKRKTLKAMSLDEAVQNVYDQVEHMGIERKEIVEMLENIL